MKHRSLILALITLLFVSCDDAVEVTVEQAEGHVAGVVELDGRINAVIDKNLYPAMAMAVMKVDSATLGSLEQDRSWFVLGDGDRIRLLEVDEGQKIARVEVLSGSRAGTTCWVSLDCVELD